MANTALVIAHEIDGPGGQVTVRLMERGYDVTTHLVTADYSAPNEAASIPDFAGFDLIAIMGSIRSVTNKPEISTWVHDELEQIRKAHDADQPVLGVCFGAQLIADALGGSVETAPVTEIGWYEIRPVGDAVNPVGPGPWMEWHHDRVVPPPTAAVLAETENAVQLFTVGRTVATQFHPEVDVEHINGWLSNADDEYLATYGRDRASIVAEMRANESRNTEQCHDLVDWFLDSIAFPVAVPATS